MIPGEIIPAAGEITLNADRPATLLMVSTMTFRPSSDWTSWERSFKSSSMAWKWFLDRW